MHRIDSTTKKADKFGAGKDGFTEGTPGVEAATEVTDDWFDGVQEELVAPIEGLGLTLTKGTRNQLWTALKRWNAAESVSCVEEILQSGAFPAGSIEGIAYDETNDVWVMVGVNSSVQGQILASGYGVGEGGPNASMFLSVATPITNVLYDVAYNGSNLWCAVGADAGGNPAIITSPDGDTPWTSQTGAWGAALELYGVAHDQSGLWVAVGEKNGSVSPYILSSSNGTTWTTRTVTGSSNYDLKSVAHNGAGQWCAVGIGSTTAFITTSPDGITWTVQAAPGGGGLLLGVCWDSYHSRWIASGYVVATGQPYMIWSSDGVTWNDATSVPSFTSPGGARKIAVDSNGICVSPFASFTAGVGTKYCNGLLVSADGGENWTFINTYPSSSLDYTQNAIAQGRGMFLFSQKRYGTYAQPLLLQRTKQVMLDALTF